MGDLNSCKCGLPHLVPRKAGRGKGRHPEKDEATKFSGLASNALRDWPPLKALARHKAYIDYLGMYSEKRGPTRLSYSAKYLPSDPVLENTPLSSSNRCYCLGNVGGWYPSYLPALMSGEIQSSAPWLNCSQVFETCPHSPARYVPNGQKKGGRQQKRCYT